MRIDFYTKFVLTVIALCLLWLSLGGGTLIPVAVAQRSQPAPDKPAQIVGGERVIIAGWVDHQGKIYPFEPVVGLPEVARGIPVSVVSGGR